MHESSFSWPDNGAIVRQSPLAIAMACFPGNVPSLEGMDGTLAAVQTWRYLQALRCTRTVYDVQLETGCTCYVVIVQGRKIVGYGIDATESVANMVALINAVQVVQPVYDMGRPIGTHQRYS